MKKYISIIIPFLILVACNHEKTPKEIFEKQQSGVCLVLNSYYYEIELPNGSIIYCSGIDEDGNLTHLTIDRSEIAEHKAIVTGTAFFIENNGTLLTNRHVVNPFLPAETIRRATSSMLGQVKEYMQYSQLQYAQQIEDLENAKTDCYSVDFWGNYSVDQQQLFQIEMRQQQLASDFS